MVTQLFRGILRRRTYSNCETIYSTTVIAELDSTEKLDAFSVYAIHPRPEGRGFPRLFGKLRTLESKENG